MAVDLATSGSLGYGIGLQAKVPDKTGLVFQLENQRLKRQALENQAQEQEEQKAAKQEAMFQKAINVDATKWHKTLVGKVNQAANEAVNEYNRLYAQNERLAQNSINQIMRKYNESISKLATDNEQRKQLHKAFNDKVSKNEPLIGDEDEAYNYLNTGDDLALTQPFQTSLGEYTFNPDSTIVINAIGQSGANKNAQQAADSGTYGKSEYRITPLGVEQYRGYDDNEVKRYMDDFYRSSPSAKIGDIAINKPKLKAAFDASGLAQTGMTFREFTDLSPKANPVASQIVDNILLDYHKGLLNTYSPKPQQKIINYDDELKSLAQSLQAGKVDTITGQFIASTEEVPEKNIKETWDAYKQSTLGQVVIKLAGGEKPAKDIYENAVRQRKTGMRERYQGAGEKAKQYTWNIKTAPPLNILNAEEIGTIREGRVKKGEAGDIWSENEIVFGKGGEKGLNEINPNRKWTIDSTGLEQASYNEIPSDLDRARGWSTGNTAAAYSSVFGKFKSVLRDKNGNPKYIVIDETTTTGEELGNTWALPYDLNTSQIVNSEEIEKPVQKKQTAKPKATTQPKSNKKTIPGFK